MRESERRERRRRQRRRRLCSGIRCDVCGKLSSLSLSDYPDRSACVAGLDRTVSGARHTNVKVSLKLLPMTYADSFMCAPAAVSRCVSLRARARAFLLQKLPKHRNGNPHL